VWGSFHEISWREEDGIKYPAPLEVSIEVTYNCPFRCLMCSSDSQRVWNRGSLEGELPSDVLFNTIDEIYKLGTRAISWSGGEPLLKEQFIGLLKYAKGKGLENWVYTNGVVWGIEPESMIVASQDLLGEVVKYSDRIMLNIQGHTEELVDYVSGIKGAFEITKECINILKSYSAKWIEAHFVPMKINYRHIKDTVKFLLERLEINRVSFLRFVPQGRGYENRSLLELDAEKILEVNKTLNQLQKEYGKEKIRIGRPLNFSFLIDPKESPYSCRAGLDAPLIQANGRIDACPAWKKLPQKYAFGRLDSNGRGLLKAWIEGNIVNKVRKINTADPQELRSKFKGECLKCRFFNSCKGRCIAQRIIQYGNLYETPDPLCPLISLHKRYNININRALEGE